jgi:thiamine-monophosphate kinase
MPLFQFFILRNLSFAGTLMSNHEQVKDLGEFGLIARLTACANQGTGVITGIGDDAAVSVCTPGTQLLTSTDMLLEDVHFRRSWHDPYRLGRKSLAVNISDLAAMGAIPRWTLLCLAIPADLPLEFLDEFTRGFLDMAGEHGVSLIGGDTCSSRTGFTVSVTIMGEQLPEQILRRSGAQIGDDIWVTGTLGDAAMGLRMLETGFDFAQPTDCTLSGVEGHDFLIARLLDPAPRTVVGAALAESGLVHSMIDISDGLLSDFGHIAELSGVGGIIRVDDLPLSDDFRAIAQSESPYPNHLALSGGEDYELCFTAPPECREKINFIMKKCGIHGTRVGIVSSSKKVVAIYRDGRLYNASDCGFNHFS